MQKIRHIVPIWLEMDASTRHLPWLRSFVVAYLDSSGSKISSKDVMKVQLALIEAFDNVVEHSYKGSRKKPVLVGMWLKDRKVHLDVMDMGRGLPRKKYSLPKETSDHGRGMFLIHRLSSKVKSTRDKGWHRLHMTIQLGK